MKITQKELASRLGYSCRHINQVFKRRLRPSVYLAKQIEAHTGIPWTSWYEDTPKTKAANG